MLTVIFFLSFQFYITTPPPPLEAHIRLSQTRVPFDLKKKSPTATLRPICFTGIDVRVENIQLFFHRRVHIGVRDENVGTGNSAIRERQVRITTI